jgi:hypothetical protein
LVLTRNVPLPVSKFGVRSNYAAEVFSLTSTGAGELGLLVLRKLATSAGESLLELRRIES